MMLDMTFPFEFTPIQDFYSDELKSWYVNGLRYTVRESDPVLASFISEWILLGKIKLVPEKGASIEGKGA